MGRETQLAVIQHQEGDGCRAMTKQGKGQDLQQIIQSCQWNGDTLRSDGQEGGSFVSKLCVPVKDAGNLGNDVMLARIGRKRRGGHKKEIKRKGIREEKSPRYLAKNAFKCHTWTCDAFTSVPCSMDSVDGNGCLLINSGWLVMEK